MSAVTWKIFLPEKSHNDRHDPTLTTSFSQKPQNDVGLNALGTSTSDDVDHEDFDENCRWPRRLLNVWNMTSYKWQPGNTYGGVSNPEYSVLSYTWGRWRISDRKSSIEALDVNCVPWEIPKINPIHFTAQQFKHILELIVNGPGEDIWPNGAPHGERSPFVWVDIACIPQFRHSLVADSEVGRQARIFRGAKHGYLWLTTANSQDLAEMFGKELTDKSRDPKQDLTAFCKLLTDPWFGSMWTLQESFIQQAAYILTNTGFCCLRERRNKPLHLFQVRGLAVHYNGSASYHTQHDRSLAKQEFALFEDLWFQSGLQGPLSASPMQVLACASFRTCEFEHDRVYGIMQIFGDDFKVGKARAAIQAPAKHHFTLSELEDELGLLVIEHFPSISQLFRHDEPPQAGRAWRICGRASVPRQLAYTSGSFNDALSASNAAHLSPESHSFLSTRAINSITWATFKGKMCPLQRIIDCSRSPSFAPIWSNLQVYLDAGTSVDTHDASNHNSGHLITNVDHVTERFGGEVLTALLLSSQTSLEVGKTSCLNGLLLIRPGNESLTNHRSRRGWHSGFDNIGLQAWARVGVCQWEWYEERLGQFYMATPEVKTLLGTSDDWQDEIGIWG